MKQEQAQAKHTERVEEPIDDLPESIYDQELEALTEFVLRNIDVVLDEL